MFKAKYKPGVLVFTTVVDLLDSHSLKRLIDSSNI